MIYFSGFAAGIYSTNSAEACHYCAVKSRANIIVVEDRKQLDKIMAIKDRLPELKAVVQYHGKPEVEGVISVRNFCSTSHFKIVCALHVLYFNFMIKLSDTCSFGCNCLIIAATVSIFFFL